MATVVATSTISAPQTVPIKPVIIPTVTTVEDEKTSSAPHKREIVAEGCVATEQWHKDLVNNGFAVVKGAIPRDRADKYADEMYGWLEGL